MRLFFALLFCALVFLPLPVMSASPTPAFSQIKTRGSTAGDEFIELFNPSDALVELNGYKLVKETASGKEYALLSFGLQQILPHSYLLLTLEGSTFAAEADGTYKTALADDNTLLLIDPSQTTVDTLSWGAGQALDNHGADESYQREWQSGTGAWTRWSAASFSQAHHAGDVWNGSASPLDEAPEPVIPPCVSVIAPSPAPQQPAATPEISQPEPAPLVTQGRVRLNEVFANPSGDEAQAEFVELYNEESFPVSLLNWSIADASKTTALPALEIDANGYLALRRSQTGLTLNNGPETITLTSQGNQWASAFQYYAAKEDVSWNSAPDGWYEAAPTPGAANLSAPVAIPQPQQESTPTVVDAVPETPAEESSGLAPDVVVETTRSEEPAQTAAATDKKSSKQIRQATFKEWPRVKANERVMIMGILAVEPGVFGDKATTLQDFEPGHPGIELYFSKAEWPDLEAGDVLSVVGKKSQAKLGDRLLLSSAEDIQLLDHTSLESQPVELAQLAAKHHRTIVTFPARLVQLKKDMLTVASGDAELRVNGKKAGLSLSIDDMPTDGTVTGLYIHSPKPELWLRSDDDLQVEAAALARQDPPTTAAQEPLPQAVIDAANAPADTPWFGPFAAASSAGGLTWYFFQEPLRQQAAKLWQRLPLSKR